MGHKLQAYKSSEYNNESDEDFIVEWVIQVVAKSDLLSAHDSIDHELDTISPILTPTPEPPRDPSPPPKQVAKPKKRKDIVHICSWIP